MLVRVAVAAEAAGWDGVFLWDHIAYRAPVREVADPWVALAAIAQATRRVRLGALVTPVARRRPQVLARTVTTLDHLSGGRMVFGAGLGLDRSGRELSGFGEEPDDRTRAAMLDEGLRVITALWSGEEVTHHGVHHTVDAMRFLPVPVQRPRVPVWIAGRWPNRPPMRRAAAWDGLFVIDMDRPQQLHECAARLAELRGTLEDFALVVMRPPGEPPAPWARAGAAWWLTQLDPFAVDPGAVLRLAAAGPPA